MISRQTSLEINTNNNFNEKNATSFDKIVFPINDINSNNNII